MMHGPIILVLQLMRRPCTSPTTCFQQAQMPLIIVTYGSSTSPLCTQEEQSHSLNMISLLKQEIDLDSHTCLPFSKNLQVLLPMLVHTL